MCGLLAPLTEENGAVLRLLVDNLPYEAKSLDEVFVHALCFERATPWRGVECVNYDPSWRDRAYVPNDEKDHGGGDSR
jgi:hypothetical protein